MFKKVLIANRGAIAVRIIRTLKKMNITSVAIYAEADIDSLHVSAADEAYSLGEGNAAQTYLDQDKVLAIAKLSGAEAVHPGYGFLSENAKFVERCEAQKITFVGPTVEQMEAFGLKHTARSLAEANGVPLLPGTELLLDVEEAINSASDIGYPIILKSTAGGGGIGMQVCRSDEELRQAFDSVKRLSANNFSNDGVFVEKYIEFARHIEVQIFGDGKGKAVSFGERDCSVQRRNQKVIEETPAPNLKDSLREELYRVAETLVAAVNYCNAGTVEFIFDQSDNTFYFLEVNTRLQVEHGVSELVYGVDLVEWMFLLAAGELGDLSAARAGIQAKGHAIQARIYAENPTKNFLPSAGLLCAVEFPDANKTSTEQVRVDSWVEAGLEVSPFYDPMLAKLICWSEDRDKAITLLEKTLLETTIQGIETNIAYCHAILQSSTFVKGEIHTRFLNDFNFVASTIDVINAGTMTTIQDYPARVGYWDVGVPPSGPFDCYSFQIGNRLLGNDEKAAGLELTLNGPSLQFNCATRITLVGAKMDASINGKPADFWRVLKIKAGDVLKIAKVGQAGTRAYLLVEGGFEGHDYLGSKSTFTLGQFGGFSGRALRIGDTLHLSKPSSKQNTNITFDKNVSDINVALDGEMIPEFSNQWQLRVIYGPHGAPDFFTDDDIKTFFSANWEVHYNSSRTGVRLIGPKPNWARATGGEAGMHPSNIHDNAYAIGSVDFTGDMPVILGPDGPSLGGFVCPATVISADLWKLGQLKAGDKIVFIPVNHDDAKLIESKQKQSLLELKVPDDLPKPIDRPLDSLSPVLDELSEEQNGVAVKYRAAGDKYLLVEYGPLELDIRLRFRAHALMLHLQEKSLAGVLELTPGIRSLQVHYDNFILPIEELLGVLKDSEHQLQAIEEINVTSRIVHIPLSWDDEACRVAIEKYTQSVRKDAPWCPSNIEFIRRINGLDSIEEVKKIVFDASYVVMGLGDVYLGAPVATPLDPRHRLVTTKYNPARTWTAENSVGIGGSYLCVYGMEGPGGYQFIGRTLQMWNRFPKNRESRKEGRCTKEFEKPWLLRFFDQIRFYEVSAEELKKIRQDFPRGHFPLKIEESSFNLKDYQEFLDAHKDSIDEFTENRNAAFDEELERWVASGQIDFQSQSEPGGDEDTSAIPEGCSAIESHVAGNIWQWQVGEGDTVKEGMVVCIVESMKMEIEVIANCDGTIESISKKQGQQINAGQVLAIIKESNHQGDTK